MAYTVGTHMDSVARCFPVSTITLEAGVLYLSMQITPHGEDAYVSSSRKLHSRTDGSLDFMHGMNDSVFFFHS